MEYLYVLIIVPIITGIILKEMKRTRDENKKTLNQLSTKVQELNALKSDNEGLLILLNKMEQEKTSGFPWFAKAFSEAKTMIDDERIRFLKYKSRPAIKSAEIVKEIRNEKKELNKENKKLESIINYYENIFPQLIYYKENDIEDKYIRVYSETENADDDSVKEWITQGEYLNLSENKRNQLALDNYKKRKKSKLQIGFDYERYIGYVYECQGFEVEYHGILKGLDDLGIDLICKKGSEILLIQCKYWSDVKEIHENAVNQLFGTTFKYCFDLNSNYTLEQHQVNLETAKVQSIIYTSTKLSVRAKNYASSLGIIVYENIKIEDYPMIKCNLNKNEKIYHLPFDQQYDKIKINGNKGAFYVYTVDEATNLGFRRAFKWRGN